jgi:hypothetical protein
MLWGHVNFVSLPTIHRFKNDLSHKLCWLTPRQQLAPHFRFYYWSVNNCFIVDQLPPRQSMQGTWRFVNQHVLRFPPIGKQENWTRFDTRFMIIIIIEQFSTLQLYYNFILTLTCILQLFSVSSPSCMLWLRDLRFNHNFSRCGTPHLDASRDSKLDYWVPEALFWQVIMTKLLTHLESLGKFISNSEYVVWGFYRLFESI